MKTENELIGGISTNQLARSALVSSGAIRVRFCQTGSYFGLRPIKLPNGRLSWPHDSLQQLMEFRASKTGGEE